MPVETQVGILKGFNRMIVYDEGDFDHNDVPLRGQGKTGGRGADIREAIANMREAKEQCARMGPIGALFQGLQGLLGPSLSDAEIQEQAEAARK